MHILTGLLLSVFLSKRANEGQSNSTERDLSVSHVSKGRIRIYSEKLKVPKVAETLKNELLKADGIHQIDVNPITGSILILHDDMKVKADLLASAVYQLLGFNVENDESSESIIYKEVRAINGAVNHALMKKSNGALDVKTLIAGGFLALGVKELMRTKSLGIPAPLTLFYWAYNSFDLNK